MLGYLLLNRKVWGLTIGFAAYGYSLSVPDLAAELPQQSMHMSSMKSAGDPQFLGCAPRSRISSWVAG